MAMVYIFVGDCISYSIFLRSGLCLSSPTFVSSDDLVLNTKLPTCTSCMPPSFNDGNNGIVHWLFLCIQWHTADPYFMLHGCMNINGWFREFRKKLINFWFCRLNLQNLFIVAFFKTFLSTYFLMLPFFFFFLFV